MTVLHSHGSAIAGALEAPCRGLASYTLGPLNNTNYLAPPKGSALPCECSTVMYSLFMACTACQGQTTQSWTSWDQNCGTVFVTQYPLEIPVDTAVPGWAYLNVTGADRWDEAASRADADLPESTGTGPTVSTIGPSSSSTRTGSDPFPTLNSPNNSSTNSGGGSHAGAIAGGVVGSLAILGIIGALVVWLVMKNRRSKVAPSSAFLKSYPPLVNFPKYEPPPPSPTPYNPPQTKYNPADTSAFPSTFHEPSFTPTTTSGYPQTAYDPRAQGRGQYNGAPEV